jgi:hypothetical protein
MSQDPIQLIAETEKAVGSPRPEAFLYAGNRQKSRILDRTSRGVDVDEQPFAPYNSSRPYYWYPAKELKNRNSARTRFFKKIEGPTARKTTKGIRFDSYAAFKASMGRLVVDLMGARAPHMLQAFVVKVSGGLLTIGIYGEEAERASAHNEGTKNLPRRHFFDASESDKTEMAADILDYTMRTRNEQLNE